MTNLQKRIASAIAAGSLFLNLVTPAIGLSFTIDGNASNSDNYINVELEREVEVEQENTADVENDVTISTNTGRNTAKDNTSGSWTTLGDEVNWNMFSIQDISVTTTDGDSLSIKWTITIG